MRHWATVGLSHMGELTRDSAGSFQSPRVWLLKCPSWRQHQSLDTFPASTRRWSNAGLMLGQRRRRWLNIKAPLVQRLVFARLTQCSANVTHIGPALAQRLPQVFRCVRRGIVAQVHGRLIDSCWSSLVYISRTPSQSRPASSHSFTNGCSVCPTMITHRVTKSGSDYIRFFNF